MSHLPHTSQNPKPRTARQKLPFFYLPFLLCVLFLTPLLFTACQNSKKNIPPNPLPGRAMEQVIQARTSKNMVSPVTTYGPNGEEIITPVFSWPPGFLRVAWLPLYTQVPTGGSIQDLDSIFRAECSKVLPLEVIQISRAEMMRLLGEQAIASTDIIPAHFVRQLQEKYAIQGIIFTDLTVYRPYRPINIGVRAKLVQVPYMEILWSADGILDSAEPGIASSALNFAQRNLRGPETGMAQVILQSPRRYAAFAANALYGTLPGQLYGVSPKPDPTPTPKPGR